MYTYTQQKVQRAEGEKLLTIMQIYSYMYACRVKRGEGEEETE